MLLLKRFFCHFFALGFVDGVVAVITNTRLVSWNNQQAKFINVKKLTCLRLRCAGHSRGGFFAPLLARFIEKVLIARTRKEFELATDRKQTGIDGVSMGGRIALLLGLSHPALFGAVGALQPAIGVDDAPWLSELAAKAVSTAPLALRLVSSEGDPFLAAVRALSKRLDVDGVKHQLVITPGPHDYVWNRGPGSAELLLWHERVLRGHPPP